MKRTNSLMIFLVAALLLMLAVSACAPAEAPPEAQAPEPTTEAVSEPAEEAAEEPAESAGSGLCGTDEEVTITYIGDPAGGHPDAEAATIERFKEVCPNITVDRIEGDANVQNLLATYLTAFEAQSDDFDVIRVDVIWPGLLAEHLLDMSEYTPQEQIDSYLPALVQNDTVDGRLVALPLRIGFGMLYYRSDLLEKYGFDAPPATWDELKSMAQTIQEGERADGNDEFWGFVWQGNAYEGLTTNALEWQVSNGGGSIVNPDGAISVNNSATIDAFERAAGWVETISPPGILSYQEEDARGVWHAGNAAFMRNWPYAYSISLESEAIGDKFDVAPLPAGEAGIGAASLGGWHMGVSRYSAQPEAAAAFVNYMTSAENQKHYSIDTSSPPAVAALYADPDIQAAMPFSSPEVVEVTTARPSTISAEKYNQLSTLYFSAVHSILTGESDAQTALELLELDIEELLGGETVAMPVESAGTGLCGTGEEVTITYIGDPAGGHPDAEAATIERFKEVCPNITVDRIEGDANVQNLLATYLTAFEAQSDDFDVIRVDVIWPGLLAEHLLDMSEYTPQEQIDSYLPALVQNDTVDGRLVALPLRIGFGMLYYRSDLLEKYGFDAPPATWDELESMAQTIQEGERADGNDEFWGFVWQGNAYEGLTTNALEWQVSNGGGSIVNPDGAISVNNSATIDAFERAAGWVETISPPGILSYQEEDARGVWHAGNAAFMRNWPYAYSISLESEAIGDKFDVAPLPAGEAGIGAASLGGWHMGVSRYSAQPEAAAAFANYMTSAENQKHYSIDTSSPPAVAALYADPDIQAAMPFSSPEVVEVTTARPSTISAEKYNQLSTLYFSAVHSILTGESDAQTALELLELDIEELLGN